MDSFDNNIRFLARQIIWVLVLVLIFPIITWGISIGYEYMDDACVRKTPYSIALDWWLIIACIYDAVFWLVIMILLCYHSGLICRQIIVWPFNIINIIWMGIGIWLLVENSQIRCAHNTVWVMSLIVITITLTVAASIIIILTCTKIGLCYRLGRYISLEENPYTYHQLTRIS
jgi:hypothetical protein